MSRNVVGLDIGTTAVRAAEMSVRRGQVVLERIGQAGLPDGAVVDGEVNDPAAVAIAIKDLWRRTRISSRRVIIGVANQRVVVRLVDLPWMQSSELRSSLGFQAGDYLPIPVDQTELDYAVIGEHEGSGGQRLLRVLLVAAQKDMLAGHLEAVREAGLRAEGIDLNPIAVLRSLGPVAGFEEGAQGARRPARPRPRGAGRTRADHGRAGRPGHAGGGLDGLGNPVGAPGPAPHRPAAPAAGRGAGGPAPAHRHRRRLPGPLAVLGGWYALETQALRDAQAEADQEQATATTLRAQRAQLQPLADLEAQIAAAEQLRATVYRNEIRFSGVMRDISAIVPDDVWLTSMAVAFTDAADGAQTETGATASTGSAGATASTGAGAPATTPGSPGAGRRWPRSPSRAPGSSTSTSAGSCGRWPAGPKKGGQQVYLNPYFTTSDKEDENGQTMVTFSATVDLSSAAYSGRYQPAGTVTP